MGKTITLKEDTWAELLKLKGELRARSLDDVIKRLIEKWRSSKHE